jgi:hypothetical protein
MSSLSSLSATRRASKLLPDGDAHKRARVPVLYARQLVFVLLLILFGASGVVAMPLAEYRSHIQQAVTELESATKSEKYESAQEHDYRLMRIFNNVLQRVRGSELVEWKDTRILVNNSWIEDEFKIFQQVERNSPRAAEILARIIERLRALEDRLTELDSQDNAVAAKSSKDQRKARLEAILRRAEFNTQPPQETILKRMWARFLTWLNNLFPRSSGLEAGSMSWLSLLAMILIFSLAAGVLGYAIYKLTPFFQRRRTKLKLDKREARIVLGERLAADKTASDLLNDAEALARKGELRAAIRKAYIALLCELGERKILTLAQHKTNHDYLRAVREKRPLLNEMQKLTNSFENHWYGFQQTTADDWTAFRSGYEKVMSHEL